MVGAGVIGAICRPVGVRSMPGPGVIIGTSEPGPGVGVDDIIGAVSGAGVRRTAGGSGAFDGISCICMKFKTPPCASTKPTGSAIARIISSIVGNRSSTRFSSAFKTTTSTCGGIIRYCDGGSGRCVRCWISTSP